MWFMDSPDNRMKMARNRASELRADAPDSEATSEPDEVLIAVSGRHFHVGSLVVVFGRELHEERGHNGSDERAA